MFGSLKCCIFSCLSGTDWPGGSDRSGKNISVTEKQSVKRIQGGGRAYVLIFSSGVEIQNSTLHLCFRQTMPLGGGSVSLFLFLPFYVSQGCLLEIIILKGEKINEKANTIDFAGAVYGAGAVAGDGVGGGLWFMREKCVMGP